MKYPPLVVMYNLSSNSGVSIHWTGLLGWTTGLESFWIRHINGVMQIISLVYVDHVITYEKVLAYLC